MKLISKMLIGVLLVFTIFTNVKVEILATDTTATEKTPEQIAEEEAATAYAIPIESNSLANWPVGPAIYGEAGIVMDMKSGAILYAKNMNSQYYPASITKVLTALIALENSKTTDMVTFTQASIDFLQYGDANIGMTPGEQISMENALYAILLASANEVSHAVGECAVKGGYEDFIADMNKRAAELGCTNSHFMNTNGLHDDNHYTTAHDMALIASAAFQFDEFKKVTSTLQYTIPPTNLVGQERIFQQNHKMLYPENSYYYEYCVGGKTGFTDQALTTLVTYADNKTMQLVAVNLKTRGGRVVYSDAKNMFEYAFCNFSKVPISGNIKSEDVKKVIDTEAYVAIPNNLTFADLDAEIVYDSTVSPCNGTIKYTYGGQFVGEATVELSDRYLKKVNGKKETALAKTAKKEAAKETMNCPRWLKIVLGVIGIVVLLFGILLFNVAKINRRKRNRRRGRNGSKNK